MSREMLNKLRFWKTKTQAAQDVDSGSSHRERAPPYMRTPPVDVDLGGTPLLPPLPLCLTPFEASRREMAPPYMRTLPVDVDLGASHQEMVQSERRTQPAEYVDLERQRIRAHNLRENTDHFRVLIIGRANAGKTTILQRVCNTTKQPKLFNPKGHKIDLSVLDPTAKRGEHNIENEMIFDSNPGYVFHDSRGFEAGRTLELDAVKSFIQHRSTAGDIREQLHAIWYCIPINDEARPITRAELNFFDECGTGRVPVIILFTKADLLDAQTIGQLVETGMSIEDAERKAGEESINNFYEKFGHLLYAKKYPPKAHIYFRDMQNITSDCSLLVKETAAVLSDDTILQLFLSVQQNYLALSIEWAIKRVMFGVQGQWSKYMEKQMITIKGILLHFHHISPDGYDGHGYNLLNLDADDYHLHDHGYDGGHGYDYGYGYDTPRIPAHLALDCVHWSSLGDNTTFQRSAFLCIATAIIVEHSYFFWKTQPSRSSEPLKKSFHTFQSSAAFKNIQDAIKELDEGHTDVPAAIVKIALDNRLSQ